LSGRPGPAPQSISPTATLAEGRLIRPNDHPRLVPREAHARRSPPSYRLPAPPSYNSRPHPPRYWIRPPPPLRCIDSLGLASAAPRPRWRSPAGLTRAASRTTPPRRGQPCCSSRSPPNRRRRRTHPILLPHPAYRVPLTVSPFSSRSPRSRFRLRQPPFRPCRRRDSPTPWTRFSPIVSPPPHATLDVPFRMVRGRRGPQLGSASTPRSQLGRRATRSAFQHTYVRLRVPSGPFSGAPLIVAPAVGALRRSHYPRGCVPAARHLGC
jgi:hypothetical protein